jgi:hypothetical protein
MTGGESEEGRGQLRMPVFGDDLVSVAFLKEHGERGRVQEASSVAAWKALDGLVVESQAPGISFHEASFRFFKRFLNVGMDAFEADFVGIVIYDCAFAIKHQGYTSWSHDGWVRKDSG